MLQTKLITATLEENFQDQLNDFLRRLEGFGTLKDIKYSHSLQGTYRHYSATVFYETSVPAPILRPRDLWGKREKTIPVVQSGHRIPLTAKNVDLILANREKFTTEEVTCAEVMKARMTGGDSTTDMIDVAAHFEKGGTK